MNISLCLDLWLEKMKSGQLSGLFCFGNYNASLSPSCIRVGPNDPREGTARSSTVKAFCCSPERTHKIVGPVGSRPGLTRPGEPLLLVWFAAALPQCLSAGYTRN